MILIVVLFLFVYMFLFYLTKKKVIKSQIKLAWMEMEVGQRVLLRCSPIGYCRCLCSRGGTSSQS